MNMEDEWTDDDKERWKIYTEAAVKMKKILKQLQAKLKENPAIDVIKPLLELIVSLTQEARFTPDCVLDKVEWCLQGIADTTLKESAMHWLVERKHNKNKIDLSGLPKRFVFCSITLEI